ncbi:hypothetical protein ScPMuIL_014652 [Solemya velum]
MASPGTISEEEFKHFAESLAHLSSQIGDMWEVRKLQEQTYLYKRVVELVNLRPASGYQTIEDGGTVGVGGDCIASDNKAEVRASADNSFDCENFDDSILAANESVFGDGNLHEADSDSDDVDKLNGKMSCNRSTLVPCTYEYNIVYSPSYSVPVLYFNVYKPEGVLASLEEVWGSVPPLYTKQVDRDRWTMLTQQEHPLLRRPYFQLHPCHTADLMKQISCRHSNYLVTWLSAVGPVVKLSLPLATQLGSGKRTNMSGRSKKHRNFVSEPMGNKSAKTLPGIGTTCGNQLNKKGINTASKVYGEYLTRGGDEAKFKNWLGSKCNANDGQQRACAQAMKDWHDSHQ